MVTTGYYYYVDRQIDCCQGSTVPTGVQSTITIVIITELAT